MDSERDNGEPQVEEFDADLAEFPIRVKRKGIAKDYILREPESTDRDAFLNQLAARQKVDMQGRPIGMKNIDGLFSFLISKCLFDKETGKHVDPKEVQTWPPRVQDVLFKRCQKMAALDEVAEEAAKKDSTKETH